MDGEGQLEKFRICTGYRVNGRTVKQFDPSLPLEEVECVYEDMPAWVEPIGEAREFEDLPAEAQAYVNRVEEVTGRPVGVISVGLGRQQTIIHHSQLDLG